MKAKKENRDLKQWRQKCQGQSLGKWIYILLSHCATIGIYSLLQSAWKRQTENPMLAPGQFQREIPKTCLVARVLQNTQNLSLAEYGYEMYKDLNMADAYSLFGSLKFLFADVFVSIAVMVCLSKELCRVLWPFSSFNYGLVNLLRIQNHNNQIFVICVHFRVLQVHCTLLTICLPLHRITA